MRLSRVLLPEPEGPISARNSPGGHLQVQVGQDMDVFGAAVKDLPDALTGRVGRSLVACRSWSSFS